MKRATVSNLRRVAFVFAAFLIAPALWAQKAVPDDGAADTKPETAKAAKPVDRSQSDKPADKAAKPAGDPHIKPGSDYPHWEWFIGYSYLYAHAGSGIPHFNGNGGSTNIEYNFNRWFGLVGDFGGYHTSTIDHVDVDLKQFSYAFGPRLNYRFGDRDRATLFGQLLLGGIHATGSALGTSGSDNAFAMAFGGGLDIGVAKHVAIRPAQFEYVLTTYDISGYRPQNNFRYSGGVVFRWGAKPITVNRPPTASCATDLASIMDGSGQTIPVRATASDPDGDTLTYAWSASGGNVDGSGPVVRWTQGNAGPGSYSVTARVDDGHGGNASCSANVRVDPKPAPRPPTVTCSVDRSTVQPGEIVNVSANGNSPEGFSLDYTWRANDGRVSGSGSRVQYDTTGLAPGTYAVTARVNDGHGGAADCVANVRVAAPAPKPQAARLGECVFKKVGSTRVDNVCSRLLDDAVVRLNNDPKSSLVLIGYQDPVKEKKGKIAETRAANAKKYVTSKKSGVDPSRVSTRTGQGAAGADTANRRVEVFLVPEGASF